MGSLFCGDPRDRGDGVYKKRRGTYLAVIYRARVIVFQIYRFSRARGQRWFLVVSRYARLLKSFTATARYFAGEICGPTLLFFLPRSNNFRLGFHSLSKMGDLAFSRRKLADGENYWFFEIYNLPLVRTNEWIFIVQLMWFQFDLALIRTIIFVFCYVHGYWKRFRKLKEISRNLS